MKTNHQTEKPQRGLMFKIADIPASAAMGIIRENVGMDVLKPMRIVCIGAAFAIPAILTRAESLIEPAIVFAGLGGVLFLKADIERKKNKQYDPCHRGDSILARVLPPTVSAGVIRRWFDPIVFIAAGLAFIWHGQWMLGPCLMIAGASLYIVEETYHCDEVSRHEQPKGKSKPPGKRLSELARMRQANEISEQEYAVQKQQIINEL